MSDNLVGELDARLGSLGFAQDGEAANVARQNAEAQGLSHNGPYEVLGVWRRGEVMVLLEHNTAPDVFNGLNALISHPPVAVLSGPKGRVAVNPDDLELVSTLVGTME